MRRRGPTFSNTRPTRLHRICRTQCPGASSTSRPGPQLLGPSEHRAIFASNRCESIPKPLRYLSSQTFCLLQVDERVFISGQIGLIPNSLSLPSPQTLALEAALSFQHVHRVVDALKNNSGGGWSGHTQGIIYWLARKADVPAVCAASAAYAEVSSFPIQISVKRIRRMFISPLGRPRSYRTPCRPRTSQRCTGREAGDRPHGTVRYHRGRRDGCPSPHRSFLPRRWVKPSPLELPGISSPILPARAPRRYRG